MIEKIRNATLLQDPFPHFIVEGLSIPEVPAGKWVPFQDYQVDGKVMRWFLNLEEGNPIYDTFASRECQEMIKEKLGVAQEITRVSVKFVRDEPGYELFVHPDVPTKLVTMLFPISGDCGTDLYDSNKVFMKTTQVLPGTGFGFKVTPTSFHGVSKKKEGRLQLMVVYHQD